VTAAEVYGEGVDAPLRVILSPSRGAFWPSGVRCAPKGSETVISRGEVIGWVRDSADPVEICWDFDGMTGGLLVLEGHRVVPGQPVAWLHLMEPDPGGGG
jgi:hypothetical protein